MTISDFDKAHIGDILAGSGDWFTAHLLRLCAHADHDNLERIRAGFPDVVAAYEEWGRQVAETTGKLARTAAAGHYHDATGHENTLCTCPSPGTYAPQWPQSAT